MNIDFVAIGPELMLTAAAILVVLVDALVPGWKGRWSAWIAGLGGLAALIWAFAIFGDDRATFSGVSSDPMFVANDFAVIFKIVFLVSLVAVVLLSYRFFAEGRYFQSEYYFLLLTSFLGMLVMPSARDLVLLFVALETVSIPAFVMSGMRKRDVYSSEASIKFFLIGVLSVALMLFGMSMIYGFTGTTNLGGIADALAAETAPSSLLLASILLVIVGFGFKVSAVPFHFWAPDTYSGSPLPVAAMLAVASKAAGFAGLINVTFIAFGPKADVWAPALGILAIITMTVGNLVALQQRDIIRLLGYSSVAQAGYMLVPFGVAQVTGATDAVALNDESVQAVLFYLATYAVMNIGAFAVAIVMHRRSGNRRIADYAGMGPRMPLLGIAMTTFLLSLAGIPPMVGFWSKFAVFSASVNVGDATGSVFAYVLAGAIAINSVIAMFYYLRLVKGIWLDPAREGAALIQPAFSLRVAILGLMALTFVFGLLPFLITDYTSNAGLLAGG